MKIKNILAALLLLASGAARAQMPDMTIPVDKAVRMGRLDNGLTYFIRYNNWPEHRANFYIAQKVGSIQEEENQRGLAHFLEHMAFNGSDHFKGNAIVEWCRSKGIGFGSDLNAYTGIDETVYNISNVPTGQQSVLDSCLLILRDWSCGLTLDGKEIDKERGVIHEEWRMRSSANSRLLERNLPKLYPGSKYGLRYPIGLMSVVDHFKHRELADYYRKWYHPMNQGIIVVGDVDVDRMEAGIKRLFGDIKTPPRPAPIVRESVPDNAEPIVIIDKDKEYPASSVELMIKHDPFPDSLKNTLSYLVFNYVRQAALGMLNDRLSEEAQKPGCPFASAQTDDGQYIYSKTKDAFVLTTIPKDPTRIAEALKAAYMTVRQAAEFGFTPTEYKRYQSNAESSLDKMYANKDKRHTDRFYGEILGHFIGNEPMPDIDYTYTTMKMIIPAIMPENIRPLLSELVTGNDSNLVIINFNNEKEGAVYPTGSQLLTAVHEARTAPVEAYVDKVKDQPLMTTPPKAGNIRKEVKSKKLDYDIVTLDNGVTVLLKKTDYRKDQVVLHGVGGCGQSAYGQDDFANLKAFNDVIGVSGLAGFSSTELEKALAGKIANANLTMGERRMAIDGSSTPKDVETMLQMVYLYFTDIHKDTDSFRTLTGRYELELKNRGLSPETAFSDSVNASLYGENWRTAPFLLKDLKDVDYDRILAMAKERTANANGWIFEIIGNFDETTIRPLVCRYLGALPSQGANAAGVRVNIPTKDNVEKVFRRKMQTPQANAAVFWLNHTMPYSPANAVKADVAGQILTMEYLRKIREEAGAAYSCGAQGSMSLHDDGWHLATIAAYCPMKPEKKDEAMKIMNDEMQRLAGTCDAGSLAKVRKILLKQFDTRVKDNGFWSGLIMGHYMMGHDAYTDYKNIVTGLTPDSISRFVAEYLKDANKVCVVMMPQE